MFSLSILLLFLSIQFSSSVLFRRKILPEIVFPITDYGAIPNIDSETACHANSAALVKALYAANASSSQGTHRGVAVVPKGSNFTFYYFRAWNLSHVTLRVEGALKISNDIQNPVWPRKRNDGGDFGSISFHYCNDVILEGTKPFGSAGSYRLFQNGQTPYESLIDGQGFDWWLYVIKTGHDWRPHMFYANATRDVEVRNLRMINSPQFHMKIHDNIGIHVHHVSIHVDIEGQKNLLQSSGRWDPVREFPTFPLNTDGIDPAGRDIYVHDVDIVNFDDAVVAKPLHSGSWSGDCTESMFVENAHIQFSCGATIGSVPPHVGQNCIRNVTFENIVFEDTLKAIYIKSNPGDNGTGLVEDITYRNVRGYRPLWYPIWIGPQQMKEPGQNGTGCSFLFPVKGLCPTQPLVTMRNILLLNVTFTEGVTIPGVILADPKNPFTNIDFQDVLNVGKWIFSSEYYSKNVKDCYARGDTRPVPAGFIHA